MTNRHPARQIGAAVAILLGVIGLLVYLHRALNESIVGPRRPRAVIIRLLVPDAPPDPPPASVSMPSHAKSVVRPPEAVSVVTDQPTLSTPSAPVIGTNSTQVSTLESGTGSGIRIGRPHGNEFPWQIPVDRLQHALDKSPCLRRAKKNYKVRAQIDSDQKLTLTRTSTSGDRAADECADTQLDWIARSASNQTLDAVYNPRTVSIDVYLYRKRRASTRAEVAAQETQPD
jgi:hypothetical protein